MNTWIYLCVFCLLKAFSLEAKESKIDTFLEQVLSNTSIVNSQQIKIPNYPNAYNPSLIPYKGGYLLSFRYISRCPEKIKIPFHADVSFIGVARLDKNFKVSEKTVQLLNIISHSPKFSLTAEDARLFNVGDRIFIFFNDLPLVQTPDIVAMYLGELIEDQGMFVLKGPAIPLKYPFADIYEKNWSPFSSGDRIYVIYSDDPRIILEVDVNTGYCQEVANTINNWDWNLGDIRGGTPAYLVNETFLTFFHSSFPAKTSNGKAYVMGAYTFDRDPPFSIRTRTPQPIGDLTDYTQENSSKVVFPGGMVVQDHLIHVAWGKADKRIFITTFDKEKLLRSMEPCSDCQ